jgi:tRNA-intron endonuclease
VETLYNVERGKLNVVDEDTNQELNFQQLLYYLSREDPNLWTNFIVYKDLRTRGFIIEIKKQTFKVYERGDFRKKPVSYQLKIISEGKPENIETLLEELESVEEESLSMKVAVVDRRGEIVYYGLEEKEL